jgi:hypothetical protein
VIAGALSIIIVKFAAIALEFGRRNNYWSPATYDGRRALNALGSSTIAVSGPIKIIEVFSATFS